MLQNVYEYLQTDNRNIYYMVQKVGSGRNEKVAFISIRKKKSIIQHKTKNQEISIFNFF